MVKVTNDIVYKDFDFRFTAHPVTGKLTMKKNNEAIKQGFKLLIMTNLYERHYRPTFGSTVSNQLFENFTAFTEEDIRSSIITAARNYSKRAELVGIKFNNNPDVNMINVTVFFRPLNSTETISIDLALERVR